MAPTAAAAPGEARAAIAARKLWYHTIEVAPGVLTPGWFDLRDIVGHLPWPGVAGMRCLDVGPYDGFLSFELERRGAAEVIAADIASPAGWDWPRALRDRGPSGLLAVAEADPGGGFEIAAQLLGSRVQRLAMSIYDLDPDAIGTFDLVVCGSLLLHLRDPMRGLAGIRRVCRGRLLSAETISPGLTLASPRRAVARFRSGDRCQWWIPNRAGHQAMIRAAGFEIERSVAPYAIPLGLGHPSHSSRALAGSELATLALTRRRGVPHSALLTRALS